jgi:hypothetical protein
MGNKSEETEYKDKVKAVNKKDKRKLWWMPRIPHIAVAVAVVAVGVAISAYNKSSLSVPSTKKDDANQAFLLGNMLYEKVSDSFFLPRW